MLCVTILSEVVLGFMLWTGWLGDAQPMATNQADCSGPPCVCAAPCECPPGGCVACPCPWMTQPAAPCPSAAYQAFPLSAPTAAVPAPARVVLPEPIAIPVMALPPYAPPAASMPIDPAPLPPPFTPVMVLPQGMPYPPYPLLTHPPEAAARAQVHLVYEGGKSRLCVQSVGLTTRCVRMKLEAGHAGGLRLAAGKNHVHLSGSQWKAQADRVEFAEGGRIVLCGHVKVAADKLGVGASVRADKLAVQVKAGRFEKITEMK